MKTQNLSLIILVLIGLTACGKSADKSSENTRKSIANANRSAEEAQKNAKEAVQEARALAEEAQRTVNETMDITSSGSQPGRITLGGALVDGNQPAAAVSVELQAGRGWRGNTKPVELGKLKLESARQEITSHNYSTGFGKYINIGCDLTGRSELDAMEEITLPSAKVTNPIAEIVLICDESLIGEWLNVAARKVVLSGLSLHRADSHGIRDISIRASELVLENENQISTSSQDSSVTPFPAPDITVKAASLTGTGTLALKSTGASYKASRRN